MTRTLYFIRHGETDWNLERRMQGRWESDLTAKGERQAEANADLVARLGVDAIYVSPLRRTRRSCACLEAATGIGAAVDERLAEWDAGAWSGFLYAEIPERWPEAWAAWRADMWNARAPDGENFVDLTERGSAFLDKALATTAGRIAIVSHGFIGRAMIGALLGLPADRTLALHTANEVVFRLTGTEAGWSADRFEAGAGPKAGLFDAEPGSLA
ncbi:MAG: histidine phosphatase family protein [Pseudomonadota bacterium]